MLRQALAKASAFFFFCVFSRRTRTLESSQSNQIQKFFIMAEKLKINAHQTQTIREACDGFLPLKASAACGQNHRNLFPLRRYHQTRLPVQVRSLEYPFLSAPFNCPSFIQYIKPHCLMRFFCANPAKTAITPAIKAVYSSVFVFSLSADFCISENCPNFHQSEMRPIVGYPSFLYTNANT